MDDLFKDMDKDTYNQTIGDDFNSFKKQYQDDDDIRNNIEQIQADMDLLIEDVNTPVKNPYLDMGLMVLEFSAPNFRYSKDCKELNYNERMNELKRYYYTIGYNNQQMLDLISNFKKRMSK